MTDSDSFYKDLLKKALKELSGRSACMVIGPIFSCGTYDENIARFRRAQDSLRKQGCDVFDQIPYLDSETIGAPFEYEIKFEVFYKQLIYSGCIQSCIALPNWNESSGTQKEIIFCRSAGVQLFVFTSEDFISYTKLSEQ